MWWRVKIRRDWYHQKDRKSILNKLYMSTLVEYSNSLNSYKIINYIW
jgi:hypothetical protein